MHSTEHLDKARFWSTIDARPVIVYDDHSDTYLAYWNGLAMTHKQAMVIGASLALNIWPSPKVKKAIFEEFKKTYRSGGFGDVGWSIQGHGPETHFKYLSHKIKDHWNKKLQADFEGKPQEVLRWFNIDGVLKSDDH